MKRRSFLKGLLAVPVVGVAAKVLPSIPENKPVVVWGPQTQSQSAKWDEIIKVPERFPPIAHYHTQEDIDNNSWEKIVDALECVVREIRYG